MAKQRTRFTGNKLDKKEAEALAEDILGTEKEPSKEKPKKTKKKQAETAKSKKKFLYVSEEIHKMAKQKAIMNDFKTLQSYIEHLIEKG